MKDTIEWLRQVEQLAYTFYREAAAAYADDQRVASFLAHLADEEAGHATIMDEALAYIAANEAPPFAILVDETTRHKVEDPFVHALELLKTGAFSWKDILDCMTTTESSEWNQVFLYIVDLLKKERQFMPVASRMHHHLTGIRDFLKSLPRGEEYIPTIRSLPEVWKEQILIVDDEPSILSFLTRLLADEGRVETASNGKEALRKVRENYFDVILTDVKMPVMDGIAFFHEASIDDPRINRRMIYFSSMGDPDLPEFFRKHELRHLTKPAPIREILAEVHRVLRASAGTAKGLA